MIDLTGRASPVIGAGASKNDADEPQVPYPTMFHHPNLATFGNSNEKRLSDLSLSL
ncbi:hypothetical protein GOD78_11035 [Sinorhizobium medicae]|nr:hypothetical protein [Sinorhizobium medicae]MDX0818052.1 hypothetical protein [Sinorhizobium medicae]